MHERGVGDQGQLPLGCVPALFGGRPAGWASRAPCKPARCGHHAAAARPLPHAPHLCAYHQLDPPAPRGLPAPQDLDVAEQFRRWAQQTVVVHVHGRWACCQGSVPARTVHPCQLACPSRPTIAVLPGEAHRSCPLRPRTCPRHRSPAQQHRALAGAVARRGRHQDSALQGHLYRCRLRELPGAHQCCPLLPPSALCSFSAAGKAD